MKGMWMAGRVVLCVAATFVIPSRALADFTNRVLLNAVGTVPGFQGTQNFLATNGTATLDANVDYAVWAPGTFPGNYVPFAGFPPAQSTDYVYAYQVYDNGPGHGQSNRAVSQLDIDWIGGTIDSLGKDRNFDPSGLDIDTNFAYPSQDGSFILPGFMIIHVNQFSIVLLLASPQAPGFAPASVFDSGLRADGHAPMPVPEPATMGLATLGLAMSRRSRRQ